MSEQREIWYSHYVSHHDNTTNTLILLHHAGLLSILEV